MHGGRVRLRHKPALKRVETSPMQTNPVPGTSDPYPAPTALDPELLALADPAGEVLMSAEPPTFVQRASVPVDVALAEPAS